MLRKKVRAISVRTTMTLTDRMTGTLQKMMKAMNSTIRAMEQMHTASNRAGDMRSLQRARRDIESASASFEQLRASARLAGSEGENAGNRLRNGLNGVRSGVDAATSSVRQLLASFTGFAAAYLSIQGIGNGFSKFTKASDNYSNSNARLNNINDGLQTQSELQDKIYKASQRSLSSYNDTAASVAKLNLLAKDAFGSNDEAIRFTELMNKSFSVSGASTQEKQAGMYQLTQAMAAGRLQGDEFRSIMENAPLLAQAIGDATGVGMEGLKKMSAEGTITASVIKSSLFGAAKDIEDKFNSMPLTFADAMTVFNNWAQKAFEPMFIRFRQFVNSDAFGVLAGHAMVFVNLFISGLSLVFDTLENVYNGVASFGNMLQSTWALVGPVILTATAALGSYLAVLIAYRGVLMVVAAYEAARTFALGVMAAASMLATGATLAQTAAVWGLNTALLAFPGTWILIAFIAVIAIVVNAMIIWAEQTASAVGFVAGIFAALGAFIFNIFANIANFLTFFAEFFINLFIDPVYAVKKLFYDLVMMVVDNMSAMASSFDSAATALGNAFVAGANIAIGAINWIIEALNKIPDVNISTVGKLQTGSSNVVTKHWQDFTANLKAPTSDKNVVSLQKNNLMNIPHAYKTANKWAYDGMMAGSEKLGGLVDKAKGLVGLGKDDKNKANPFSDKASLMDNVMNTAPSETGLGASGDPSKGKLKGGKLDTVGKIEDKINLADEYLELFKDIAEGKAINNIVSLTPNLQVHNNFEDTAGSVLSKVLNKIGDLSNVGGYASKLNDFVSQSLNSPSRDEVSVSKEVRENVTVSQYRSSQTSNTYKSEPKIYFTGDINEKVDVDDVVKAITQGLKDEQDRSVEGVYG